MNWRTALLDNLLLPPEAVGLLKLVAQRGRAQVFAQMREPLLQREQSGLNRFRVGEGNVAPHGVGAGAEPRHLAQRAAAHVFQLRRVAHLFFSSALRAVATNCGRWLTQATNSSWRAGSRSRVFEPMAATHSRQPFTNSAECGERCQAGRR